MAKLILERPLVIFDTETTGVDLEVDRVIQVAFTLLFPEGDKPQHGEYLINPERPIAPEATEVHGITDEMVQNAPTFEALASYFRGVFFKRDYAGFNVSFDLKMMWAEFKRFGHRFTYEDTSNIIECRRLWQILEPRTLSDAARVFLGVDHVNAHDAMGDTDITRRVMIEQLGRLAEREGWSKMTPLSVHEFCNPMDKTWIDRGGKFQYDANGNIIFGFGRYRNQRAVQRSSYLDWMLRQSFSPHVHAICRALIDGDTVPSLADYRASIADEEDETSQATSKRPVGGPSETVEALAQAQNEDAPF